MTARSTGPSAWAFAALLLLLASGAVTRADELPPVELPHTASVVSFRVWANGIEVPLRFDADAPVAHIRAGRGSNTIRAELRVRARGHGRLGVAITFDGEDVGHVAADPRGENHTFTATKTVGPNDPVAVGYLLEVQPRMLRGAQEGAAFDAAGGLSSFQSGVILVALDDAFANGGLSRAGYCDEAVASYLRRRPIERWARWTAAQVATNLVDLAFAYFGGGFIHEAIENAIEARWVVATWKRWLATKLAQISAGAAYDFAKSMLGSLIEFGELIPRDVPREIMKAFVNGAFGSALSGMAEWEGTWANFVAQKATDALTVGSFAAWEAAAGERDQPRTPEGEALADALRQGAQEKDAELRRRGLTSEYFRMMKDETVLTSQGKEHRIRVLGAQWLVTGEGAILILCDPVPENDAERRGYLIRFTTTRDGRLRIPPTTRGGTANGITEFRPVRGQDHSAELLAREILDQRAAQPGSPARGGRRR